MVKYRTNTLCVTGGKWSASPGAALGVIRLLWPRGRGADRSFNLMGIGEQITDTSHAKRGTVESYVGPNS